MSSNSDQSERREPADITRLMRDGDAHLREGRGTQADECFREILERQPDNPDALHRCGMIAFLRGDPHDAARLLHRATSTRGDDATLSAHLARALMACGKPDEAIPYLRRVIESTPDSAVAYERLGDAYFAKGDIEASETAYRQSIDMDPDALGAFVSLGRALHFSNRNPEAEDALHRALELGGGSAHVCMLVGTVVLEAGGLDAALELFEAVVRAEPEEPRGHASRGLALHWLGRSEEAQASYRRALDIDPSNSLALKHLGVLLQERDELDAAAECFEKLLEMNLGDDVARHMLAATTGETTPGAPAGYITRVYDDYADRFDAHLDTIAYNVPELIRDAVAEVTGSNTHAWRVLDLGCGTGKCGEAVRPFAAFLAGVDLSPRMAAKGRERNVYDSLEVGSIDGVLEGNRQPFDLIVAGDVFIHIGDLSRVFAGCARTLSPGGLMAFSVENADGDTFCLRPTGRYAHSVSYIDATAGDSGMSVVYRRDVTIRNDPIPIAGQVFVLSKVA